MRKIVSFGVIIGIGVMILLSGCNGLKKMVKNSELVKYDVLPNPFELHGDSIEITINGHFPEKYFPKKAKLVITPTLVANGTEVKLKKLALQGESVEGDAIKIKYKSKSSFSYIDKIPYQPGLEQSKLVLKAIASVKDKIVNLPEVEVGQGTITTALLIQPDDKTNKAADKFTKTVPVTQKADIHFTINQSNINYKELKSEDIEMLGGFLDEAKSNEKYELKNLRISSYASPDGSTELNSNLADNRGKNSQNWAKKLLHKHDVDLSLNENFVQTETTAEDWDGFKELMENSNIEDKELIVRVLSMYSDPEKREEEIKKIAQAYEQIADDVLPQLRRSNIFLETEMKSKTDEELLHWVDSLPDSLNSEELLYATTLTKDIDKDIKLYNIFNTKYPEEWRGYNNLGIIYLEQKKLDEAKNMFEKAAEKAEDKTMAYNNLGIVYRWKSDIKTAKDYFNKAAALPEAQYNMGIIAIKEGNYQMAIDYFGNTCSLNAGLAYILNKEYDKAAEKIECCEKKETAIAYYLKAIIAARTNNQADVFSNLKEAIAIDSEFGAKAKTDLEFFQFFSIEEFKQIVN